MHRREWPAALHAARSGEHSSARGRRLVCSGRRAGAGRSAGHLNPADSRCDTRNRPAPPPSTHLGVPAEQDAVLLGSGNLGPPRLLQGQLVSRTGLGGLRAGAAPLLGPPEPISSGVSGRMWRGFRRRRQPASPASWASEMNRLPADAVVSCMWSSPPLAPRSFGAPPLSLHGAPGHWPSLVGGAEEARGEVEGREVSFSPWVTQRSELSGPGSLS